jgi:hypothetical protein
VFEALGKGLFALGKGFVECHTWQKALDKKTNSKASFAECRLSFVGHLAKKRRRDGVVAGDGNFAESPTLGKVF